MKTTLKLALILMLVPLALSSQKAESQYIEWMGDDEIANAMVARGMGHMMNVEREMAFTFFEAAVSQDPSLFAPHVVLANLSWGEKRKHHIAEAKKNVEGKNEVSQLFVSTLDTDWQAEGAADKNRAIWAKMFELAYDGGFVNFRYALSRKEVKEQITELEKLAARNEKKDRGNAHVHNILGYMYYADGDKEKAKAHLDKYLELRPNGYNAYDSMGEYYFNEGDMENALAYYKKARMHYPASRSANDKIEEIEEKMKASKSSE